MRLDIMIFSKISSALSFASGRDFTPMGCGESAIDFTSGAVFMQNLSTGVKLSLLGRIAGFYDLCLFQAKTRSSHGAL